MAENGTARSTEGFRQRAGVGVEQEEDKNKRERERDLEPLIDARHRFILATPRERVTGGKEPGLFVEKTVRLGDVTGRIAPFEIDI